MKHMTRMLSLIAVVVLATTTVFGQEQKPAPKPHDLTGKWALSLELAIGPATPTLVLKQAGEKLTGTYIGRYGEFALAGTVKGNAINFAFEMSAEGQTVPVTFVGDIAPDGQSMKGTGEMGGMGDITWSAKRSKE